MNKQKFEAKVKELYAYEDEMIAEMQEFIRPYNAELNKQGCEAVCDPFWYDPSGESYEESVHHERLSIKPKQPYSFVMSVAFKRIGDDLENGGMGFITTRVLTAYEVSLYGFGWWVFRKLKSKKIFKEVEESYLLVKNEGIERARQIVCKEKVLQI